jgi:hypothetical protein
MVQNVAIIMCALEDNAPATQHNAIGSMDNIIAIILAGMKVNAIRQQS